MIKITHVTFFNKTIMKKILGIALALAVICGIGYGVYHYLTPVTTKTKTLVYDNATYGFTLEFPETWAGYTATDNTSNWGGLGESDLIDFGFEAQDSLFALGMYEKSLWEKILVEEGLKPTKIGENDKYIFAYSGSLDVVNDEMATRRAEVDAIIKTFKMK